MKKMQSIILLICTSLCLMIVSLPAVSADATTESFVVFTDKQDYLIGEAVNIYAKAEAIDPDQTITIHDVIVYDSNNVTVAELYDLEIVLTDTETVVYVGTFIATAEGQYSISAKATGCPWFLWAFWFFRCLKFEWNQNVIPELPFGTIAAMAAFICATSLYVIRKKGQNKA